MKQTRRRAPATESTHEVHGKERCPAQYEAPDDDADGLRGALLFVETAQL